MPTAPNQVTEEANDATLMLRYSAGDLAAFKELYGRHNTGLYRFIAWRSPRSEWVDEIIQDSWMALHHARENYQPSASFRTFLYQIAKNRLIDLLRQHQLVLAVDLGYDENGDAVFDHLADQSQAAVMPENALIDREQEHQLQAALDSLPSVQKEAIVLQQFSDLSLEEIASISAVSVETIKSRLRYAMRKLRMQLCGSNAHTQTNQEEHV
ncbi:MAG: sigma-70 family RNA polymerase sigma factor [Undibacterium sp.]|nr:sigma-70 family RNA polymerase sigma factor [Undibacterium sp.]